MKLETISVAELFPYELNARTHTESQVGQIAASISEFGWTVPILVDGGNTLIAGHGRLLAAEKLGLDQVPVIRIENLTDAQIRGYRIADNKLTELGGWDDERLAQEFAELMIEDFDVTLTGFDLNEVDGLLALLDL